MTLRQYLEEAGQKVEKWDEYFAYLNDPRLISPPELPDIEYLVARGDGESSTISRLRSWMTVNGGYQVQRVLVTTHTYIMTRSKDVLMIYAKLYKKDDWRILTLPVDNCDVAEGLARLLHTIDHLPVAAAPRVFAVTSAFHHQPA